MTLEVSLIRSGRDPELPITHHFFALGDTRLLVKYRHEIDEWLFRWNAPISLDSVLAAHTNSIAHEHLSTPFAPTTVLDAAATPVGTDQVIAITKYLTESQDEPHESTNWSDGLRVVELWSADRTSGISWNTNPDRELTGEQAQPDFSSLAVKLSDDLFSPEIVAWYLGRFPPEPSPDTAVTEPQNLAAELLEKCSREYE